MNSDRIPWKNFSNEKKLREKQRCKLRVGERQREEEEEETEEQKTILIRFEWKFILWITLVTEEYQKVHNFPYSER